MSERIFISYKRKDKKPVFKIKDDIETYVGEKCWIDIDGIESDAQFVNVIIKAIDDADIFLFMYSKRHINIEDFENDWTIREINYAQKRNKRIIFLNLDGSQFSPWFELMFGLKQQVDVSSESAMNKLYDDLIKWLDVKDIPLNKTSHSKFPKIAVFVTAVIIVLSILGIGCYRYIEHKRKKEIILAVSKSHKQLNIDFNNFLKEANRSNIYYFDKAYQSLLEIERIESDEFFLESSVLDKNKEQLMNKVDSLYFDLYRVYQEIPEVAETAKQQAKNKLDSIRMIQLKLK